MDDVKKMVELNVDELRAKIGGLPAESLALLLDAENAKSEPRSTVKEAIETEQKSRQAEAETALETAKAAADRAGIKLAIGEDVDALEVRVTEAEEKAKEAMEKAAKSMAKAVTKRKGAKARTIKLDPKAVKEPSLVIFVNDKDQTSQLVPDLEFDASQFEKIKRYEGENLLLRASVRFPQSPETFAVKRVFVADAKGKAFGECTLVAPLVVGGGSNAEFAANTLEFRTA